jgi:hypothetical protein
MADVINTKVIKNYQTAEYGKFVELLDSRYPSVSVVRLSYPDTSSAFPSNSSAGPLSSVEIYPKYGILSHITNFDDLSITLSANDVTIGAVEIKDGNSGLRADVVDAGSGLNALRVISQDLESSVDDITIGDRTGNLVTVQASQSALRVYPVVQSGGYTKCETKTSGNPSFIPDQILIHNNSNNDINVTLTLTSGMSCLVPIGKNSSSYHILTLNLAVSAVNNYNGTTITFFA